jgi:hypothetical protein
MLAHVRESGGPNVQRFAWLIESFIDEALSEMADGTPEQIEAFFQELARLINWVATGELDGIPTAELTSGFKPLVRGELESARTS